MTQTILKIAKGDRTIIKFSTQRKFSEVLNKKNKLKYLDIGKYGLNDGSRIYIIESVCPYQHKLWSKCKVITSFYMINGILQVKKSKHDNHNLQWRFTAVQWAGITSKSCKKIFSVCLQVFFSEVSYELRKRKNKFILIFWQIHYILLFSNMSIK